MRAAIVALSAALVLSACGGSDNKLVGKWTLAKGDCSTTALEFTDSTYSGDTRAIGPYPAEHSSNAVTYNIVDPKEVWVIGSAGLTNAVGYKFLGDDRIQIDNWTFCEYARA